MRLLPYVGALALLTATSGCGDWANHRDAPPQGAASGAFGNGLRTDQSQPTNCSPADNTCGTGIRNPSVQSPTQKREYNSSSQ